MDNFICLNQLIYLYLYLIKQLNTMQNVKQFIQNYKAGAFVSVVTERPVKVKKSAKGMVITKRAEMVARLGVNYDNLKQTNQKREDGDIPKENAGLPWGEWDIYPFLIKHKNSGYVRMYANKAQIRNKFFMNGAEVEKSEIEQYILASEKSKPTEDSVLTLSIKSDNIIKIK